MSTLARRFFFGTLLLGGALGALAVDHLTREIYGFLGLGLVFSLVGWWELVRIAELPRSYLGLGAMVICAAILLSPGLVGGTVTPKDVALLLLLPLVIPALAFPLILLRRTPTRESLGQLAIATMGGIYLAIPLMCCVGLRSLRAGESWVLLLILLVKGNDIGAYLVGRKLGRTRFSPVSPNKTIEGCLGGLLLGVTVAVLFAWLPAAPLFSIGVAIGIGIVVGVAGQTGDLAESYLKRSYGVKDSGAIVPTFGGSLDILDSVLFGGPVLYCAALLVS